MLPNFIIIGAQKCGTTSLHYYLSKHPQIFMSHSKELGFFVAEQRWRRGLAWYEAQFATRKARRAKIRGETTPAYSHYPRWKGVPERMAGIVPDAKLLYIVGDPVRRIVSHYMQANTLGREDRPFHVVMDEVFQSADFYVPENYIGRSRYFFQLSQYFPYYQPEQILIVAREDLLHHRLETLQRIFRFLEVDENFSCWQFERVKHITTDRRRKTEVGRRLEKILPTRKLRSIPFDFYVRLERYLFYFISKPIERPQLDDDIREQLIAALKDDARALREFTGQKFESWCL